jgi:hypothetical protein
LNIDGQLPRQPMLQRYYHCRRDFAIMLSLTSFTLQLFSRRFHFTLFPHYDHIDFYWQVDHWPSSFCRSFRHFIAVSFYFAEISLMAHFAYISSSISYDMAISRQYGSYRYHIKLYRLSSDNAALAHNWSTRFTIPGLALATRFILASFRHSTTVGHSIREAPLMSHAPQLASIRVFRATAGYDYHIAYS